ncbi:MAG TPA: tRNA (adenosine(37)-N6)-threonylcarbamoyltransferase complex ATPase subunit type 1 TsaE [Actinomycetota bacterium]|jgi:tRNA threonylcarbamoyladenosine biosynthesis protein TsaE|nr:tRNA (adenosine(37)-N6)-threonylcarbamoyltransferase complex ATPase subunit type 1 TsaE [Actinomycetota bacterium]
METRSSEETKRLAVSLAPILVPGDMIVLSGDLGAGKTTFVQGLAVGLGIAERVTSPTFVLMKEYLGGRYPLMHLDIYRLNTIQDVIDLGYDEFLDPSYVVAMEWGDMVEPLLPKEHLNVELKLIGGSSRTVSLTPRGVNWMNRMPTVRLLASELFSAGRSADPGAFGEDFLPGEESGRNN